jgi:uncharacterized protein (TIGR02246 family)
MQHSRRFALLAILTSVIFASGQDARAQTNSNDPSALLAAWAEAYGAMDAPRIAALYTEDARLWGIASREQSVGRAAIQASFSRPRAGVTAVGVTYGEHGVTRLGESAAVASGHWVFRMTLTDGSERQAQARFSITMTRLADGAWRIADHHSSFLPMPPRP